MLPWIIQITTVNKCGLLPTSWQRIKGTQHAAQWSYWSDSFNMNLWLKSSLVRAIGKVICMHFILARTHDGKWPFFVNKQLFWWSASTTLDNNKDILPDFQPLFSLYTLPHTSVGLTSCTCISIFFFSLRNVDPYDHYAVCCAAW